MKLHQKREKPSRGSRQCWVLVASFMSAAHRGLNFTAVFVTHHENFRFSPSLCNSLKIWEGHPELLFSLSNLHGDSFMTAFSLTGPWCAHMFTNPPPVTQTEFCVHVLCQKEWLEEQWTATLHNGSKWMSAVWQQGKKRRGQVCPCELVHRAQLHVNCRESFIPVNNVKCLIGILSFFLELKYIFESTEMHPCIEMSPDKIKGVQVNLNTVCISPP